MCVCVRYAIKFLRSFWNVISPRFSILSQIHPAATATLAIPLFFILSAVNGTVFFAAVVVVAMNHMQKQKIETAVYFLKIFIIRCASGDGGKVNQCVNKLCVCDCAYTVRISVCVCVCVRIDARISLFSALLLLCSYLVKNTSMCLTPMNKCLNRL